MRLKIQPPNEIDIRRRKHEIKVFLSRTDVQGYISRIKKNKKLGVYKTDEDLENDIKFILGRLDLHEGWAAFFRTFPFNQSIVLDYFYDPHTPIYNYDNGRIKDVKSFPETTKTEHANIQKSYRRNRIETTGDIKVALYKHAKNLSQLGSGVYIEDLINFIINNFKKQVTKQNIRTILTRYQDKIGVPKKERIKIVSKSKIT